MKVLIGLIFFSSSLVAVSQHTLKIKISQIKEVKGELEICIYDTEESYMWTDKATKCFTRKVGSAAETFVFENLPPGTYAAVVIQDVNSNGDLDTNFIGIPKEPYGFSTNPSTIFGPPDFEGASFKLNVSQEIEIKLK